MLASFGAVGLDLEMIKFSIALAPPLDQGAQSPSWSVAFAFGAGWRVAEGSLLEVSLASDAELRTPSATVLFRQALEEPFRLGVGTAVHWFPGRENYGPVVAVLMSAGVETPGGSAVTAGAETYFSPLTFSLDSGGWSASLVAGLIPAFSVYGEIEAADHARAGARLTLQPLMLDTTQFARPVGRITDHLLLVPTFSGNLQYLP